MTLMRIKPLCDNCGSYLNPTHSCDTTRVYVREDGSMRITERTSVRTTPNGTYTLRQQSAVSLKRR